tara:strand:+ start:34 stop:459 length:426 start_codon:yes stop_codon:yes gene_type:complete
MDLNKVKESCIIQLSQRDIDSRGSIISLCDEKIKNVSLIVSNKNTLRSNHYHKTDWHLIYVLSGSFYYFFKKIDNSKVKKIYVDKNQCVFTPPLEIHSTFFPVKTKLIVLSKNERDQINYEKDTVRVKFVDFENLYKFLDL